VLLHKLKAASNLSDDPSCISKETIEGAIFDTNSGIQPPQLLSPVEEDLGSEIF
jgi:hypothetical protein